MLGGIGSEAISAVPVRANTRSISGNSFFRVFSIWICISKDCVRLVPGMRSACMAKSPSLRLGARSEEHTSELQSQSNLVCRLLLEKKKKINLIIAVFIREQCK